jgi:hypothetical protein
VRGARRALRGGGRPGSVSLVRPLGLIAMLLVAALCALVPLAFASPPDPLWIGGVYDAGDPDDAIVAAGSTDVVPEPVADGGRIFLTAVAAVPPARSGGCVSSALPVRPGRAPPAA